MARPPAAVPPTVARVLTFAKLSPAALATVRKALDTDDGFRALVAAVATPEAVGEAAMVWLTRGEGWEATFADLAQAHATASATAGGDVREVRRLERALKGAESATARADKAVAAARARLDRAEGTLADERRLRKEAETARHDLAERLGKVEAERTAAVRSLKEHQSRAERTIADLRAELAQLRTAAPVVTPEPPPAPIDTVAILGQIRGVVEALGTVAHLLDPDGGDPARRTEGAKSARPKAKPGQRRPGTHRKPAKLPPAIRDDSKEAAAHLVRVPGMLLLVDGYNVTKTAWPDLPPLEQRTRLESALDELHARTGADPLVIFDGVSSPALPSEQSIFRAVRIRFTETDVEADDVILEQLEQLPLSCPVLVVSSDRRVRDGAKARGANVISSAQLLSVMGR